MKRGEGRAGGMMKEAVPFVMGGSDCSTTME